jgi:hypothetical protein
MVRERDSTDVPGARNVGAAEFTTNSSEKQPVYVQMASGQNNVAQRSAVEAMLHDGLRRQWAPSN